MRIVIYLADHRPAHVHVMAPDGEAVFNLNCPNGPCELRENYGVKARTLNKIERLINGHINELCGAWEGIHGIA
ncbi:MAG: DUF4160 domain-containing protein [Terriglobales bacterium]